MAGNTGRSRQSAKRRSPKKRRFRFQWNIGTLIFAAILIYLLILFVIYMTSNHITSYQVVSSPLAKNETYSALVLRDETLYTADVNGYPVYFTADEGKTSKNAGVVALSENSAAETSVSQSGDTSRAMEAASQFSGNYDGSRFSDVYNLKYSLRNAVAVSGTDSFYNGTVMTAQSDGIVCYSTDGMEDLDENSVTIEDFSAQNARLENLMTDNMVHAGDPVYRLINSEEWSLLIPVTDKQTVRLAEFKTIKVKFQKDGNTETGNLTLLKNGDQRYVKITFYKGLQRYCSDRLLEVELITNTNSGLKIPVSSLVTKEFYLIPEKMCVSGGDSDEVGFMQMTTDEDGEETTSFVAATLYESVSEGEDENAVTYYYVDKSLFQEGDVLIQPDSSIKYTIGKTASLQGVYCINKGYAVFRKVVITEQNEEYCIVEKNTSFGLSEYDFIVWDASNVKEDEIL